MHIREALELELNSRYAKFLKTVEAADQTSDTTTQTLIRHQKDTEDAVAALKSIIFIANTAGFVVVAKTRFGLDAKVGQVFTVKVWGELIHSDIRSLTLETKTETTSDGESTKESE